MTRIILNRRYIFVWAIVGAALFSFLGYLLFDNPKKEDSNEAKGVANTGPAPRQEIEISEVSGSDPTTADTIRKVGNHMLLPDGEVVVAEVVDPEASRAENPIFYKYAQKGDKVLIYPDRAILYNPASDKIVDIMHIAS